jgi:pimeloyl-ACP methyl ester carboxylesterase
MERRTISVHGHQISYRTAGDGPTVLLIHGMAGSSSAWLPVMEDLAERFCVVAPDLPGHGQSDKPRGDYSLGAQASMLRDLLVALGHPTATVVGQSLGGGIAMQFAYQYPERVERLVLVCAGGLGQDVMPLLRALTLPGMEYVLPIAFQPVIRSTVETVTGWAAKLGLRPAPATLQMWRSYTSLIDDDTREAFLHTLRSVVDVKGQRVSARDRLYLTERVPTLVMWGADDPVIPVSHAHEAHEAMPGSRLEIIEGAGHFPHCEEPRRFARLLIDFMDTTEPAHLDHEDMAAALQAGSAGD